MDIIGAEDCRSQDMIKEQLIPIPPLTEQLRINEKLEELMPYIEKYGAAYLEGKIKKEKNPSYIFRGADNSHYPF